MARVDNLHNYLTDVATAIKNKKGDQTPIKASDFDTEITNLPSGGGDIYDYFVENAAAPGISTGTAFCKLIKKIPKFNNTSGTSFQNLFYSMSNLEEVDISGLNFSKITTLANMFYACSKIRNVDFGTADFSSVTKMEGMFQACSSLETVDFSKIKTPTSPILRYIHQMFQACTNLTEIKGSENLKIDSSIAGIFQINSFVTGTKIKRLDLSGISTVKISSNSYASSFVSSNSLLEELLVPNFNVISSSSTAYFATGVFSNNPKLKKLDLPSWVGTGISNLSTLFNNDKDITEINMPQFSSSVLNTTTSMFAGCTSLQKIDIRSMDFSKVTSYSGMFGSGTTTTDVPYNCQIIVKDQTTKDWINSKFPNYTNVVIASEL